MSVKRYIGTFTVYVFAETDKKAFKKLKKIEKKMKEEQDSFELEEMHINDFGKIRAEKIDINELHRPKTS